MVERWPASSGQVENGLPWCPPTTFLAQQVPCSGVDMRTVQVAPAAW